MPHGHASWVPLVLAAQSLFAPSALLAAQPLPACHGPAMKIIRYEMVDILGAQIPAGDVIVEFTVDASGQVSDPKVLNASDARLEEYALKSATLWRYAAPAAACRHRMQVLF